MAVNIDGDTGIDKVQPGSVDGVDLSDGSVSSPKLDTNIAVTGTLSAGGTVTAPAFSGDGSSLTGIAGGFSNMDVFTSPGTWTNPGNVQKVKVTVVGGGGGGNGRGNSGYNALSGGGGGGSAIEVIPFPTGTNVPVTVGPAGSPGINNTSNGNATPGGTSSFGAYCSASGGTAGRTETQPVANANAAPGGNGSGGALNLTGQDGTPNAGGNSLYGVGGSSTTEYPTNAHPGHGYGGGGGCSRSSVSGQSGGAGTAGVVIVEY